jgi:LmbE family N-acetylglucosaminyl deacetylase
MEKVTPALLVVTAHPDDEAFGTSGTLARYGAEGVRTALICVTRGERRGFPRDWPIRPSRSLI